VRWCPGAVASQRRTCAARSMLGGSPHAQPLAAMRNSSRNDLGAIARRILLGDQLTVSQRLAGFSVLSSDVDEARAVAAVWLLQAGSPDPTEHAFQFERIGSWRCLGWSSGSARILSLTGRPSIASAPAGAIELFTSGSIRSRLDRERQSAGGYGDLADSTGWVAYAGFRLAAEAETLQLGERLIRIPDHGYVIAAWRSPAAGVRPPIAALRKDGSPLTVIGPNEHMDSLNWKNILTALGEESPPGPRK